MKEDFNKMIDTTAEFQEKSAEIIKSVTEIAKPEAVFGEPIAIGNHKIVTASEVSLGLGIGFGGGGGAEPVEDDNNSDSENSIGMGVGGGGGGGGYSRPVAVIKLSLEDVSVEPILDFTKIGLAFFAALGTLFVSIGLAKRAKSR
jgi:uncharacterized spore protein YtfJ